MKIEKVIPGAEYCITVCFDNKHSVTIDMKNKLHTVRFSELRKTEIFNSAQTDGRAILWTGGLSIAVSEIVEIITK